MKKIGLLFLIVFLVSCGLNTNNSSIWINTQTWTENYSQTWTENTNSGENLSDNNVTQMQTKQTQWLQNGDIVAIMKTDNGTSISSTFVFKGNRFRSDVLFWWYLILVVVFLLFGMMRLYSIGE